MVTAVFDQAPALRLPVWLRLPLGGLRSCLWAPGAVTGGGGGWGGKGTEGRRVPVAEESMAAGVKVSKR